MNPSSGAQQSTGAVATSGLFVANSTILPSSAASDVVENNPGLGAAVDTTSVLAAATALPDGNAGVGTEQEVVVAAPQLTPAEVPEVPFTPEEVSFTEEHGGPQGPERAQATNPDFCDGHISHADSVVIPQLDKPDYLEAIIDPAFGSRVVRITDSAFGEVNKPAYSTMQAWNSDESYLLLYRTGTGSAGHKLLDGHTYEFIRDLDITPSDVEQVFWSHTDANVFYYISKRSADYGLLKQFNISTDSETVLADFSGVCGAGLPSAGSDVQMHSVTDDLFGFNCQQDDGHFIMFSFQPSTEAITTAPVGMGTTWTEWSAPVPAPSGDVFWHQGFVIGPDLQQVVYQQDMSNPLEHGSIGQTHDGSDAYYQVAFNSSPHGCNGDVYQGVGHLVEHNMNTGGCRNIISEEHGYPYTTSSTHVSAQAYLQPERVALSSIGRQSQFVYFTNGIEAPALLSEVYVAQTEPDNTKVCRIAHHRSYGKMAVNGGYEAYFGEPHATISPSGTRVVFGSDWYDSGSVDSYVVELSDYEQP